MNTSNGFIVDIDGLKKEAMHELWWNTLEKLYNDTLLKVKKLENNIIFEEDEKKLIDIIKSQLFKNNTWGIFMHYLCYDGDQNVWTNDSFDDHLDSIDMNVFLKSSTYMENCVSIYFDAYILKEFVCQQSKGLKNKIISFEEHDTGRVTIIYNDFYTDDYKVMKETITSFFKDLKYDTSAITRIHIISIPSYIANFCSLFLPVDVNIMVIFHKIKKNVTLDLIDELMAHITPKMSEHFLIKTIYHFFDEYYEKILKYKI